MKALILSDKRKGHENQSIAFCKHFDYKYQIVNVSYGNKFIKLISYILAFLNIWIKIFKCDKFDKNSKFDFIVSAGSTTYYPLKYFSKKLNAKSIAMMFPSGYKIDFDLVFTMMHDDKTSCKNSLSIPVNLSYLESKNYYKPSKRAVGIIIGGDSKHYKMDKEYIKKIILEIKEKFYEYEILITTSPRTPRNIETFVENIDFNFKVIYSKNPINPIYDFLTTCEYVFITSDSTSMISESVSFGKANIEVIKLKSQKNNTKFDKFIYNLQNMDYIHIYDGTVKNTAKFDIKLFLKSVKI